MKIIKTLALGACMTVALVGSSFAQMSSMSSSEKATMTKCQGMSQSAMMQNSDCSALMKKYPDISKGTTGSSATNPGMSPGASSGTGMNKTK